MQSLERGNFTEEQVREMLLMGSGSRTVRFRYDLLDKTDRKKGELERVSGGEVSMSAFSTIKRTAKFTIEEEQLEVRKYFTWETMGSMNWSEL